MIQTPLRFRSELNFAIAAAFRRRGIPVPFPPRDLPLQGANSGASPPPRELGRNSGSDG